LPKIFEFSAGNFKIKRLNFRPGLIAGAWHGRQEVRLVFPRRCAAVAMGPSRSPLAFFSWAFSSPRALLVLPSHGRQTAKLVFFGRCAAALNLFSPLFLAGFFAVAGPWIFPWPVFQISKTSRSWLVARIFSRRSWLVARIFSNRF
jgi:hypothetical protein